MKIGIPKALLYYWYGHIWEKIWRGYGFEVIVSGPTDRRIIADGMKVALDELCLPVKIFLGHVQSLAVSTDLIMIPHLIKVEPDAYLCPKFMGLPDIVAHTLPMLKDKLLTVKFGPRCIDMIQCIQKAAVKNGLIRSAKKINTTGILDRAGDSPALTTLKMYPQISQPRFDSRLKITGPVQPAAGLTIGLLGHPYCLYDACFNLNMFQTLTVNQINFLTPEMMPGSYHGIGSGRLNKKLFWTIGRSQFDSLEWMLHDKDLKISGFIHLAAFACGLEAIVGDMLERRIKAAGRPFLRLNFEEHSGEAGLVTRLEAFINLLKYRERVS